MKHFKSKISIVSVLALVGAGIIGIYFVVAQTVTDTYDNDNKIESAWNISTSTSGQLQLASKTCDVTDWFCSASTTCANYAGDGDYIIVAQADASGSKQWKTVGSDCDQPECGKDGGQVDNLVNDNTVDFTDYPARDYCKSIGARLPTIDELSCIYTNRTTFGDNFSTGNYWSGTEYSGANARYVNFSDGSVIDNHKANSYSVRCVRGW